MYRRLTGQQQHIGDQQCNLLKTRKMPSSSKLSIKPFCQVTHWTVGWILMQLFALIYQHVSLLLSARHGLFFPVKPLSFKCKKSHKFVCDFLSSPVMHKQSLAGVVVYFLRVLDRNSHDVCMFEGMRVWHVHLLFLIFFSSLYTNDCSILFYSILLCSDSV